MQVSTLQEADLVNVAGAIFDLDGTLVNSMPLHIQAWQRLATEFNFTIPEEWLYAHGGVPSYKIGQLLIEQHNLQGVTGLDLSHLKTKYYQETIHKVEIFPEMLKVLALLQQHHIPMAIGTGTYLANAQIIVAQTPLHNYISTIVSAEDVQRHKPFPDTFLEAAKRIHVVPQHSVVFEDTPLGIEAGKSGGFKTVLVKNGKPIFAVA